MYFITSHLISYLTACSILLTRILIAHFTFHINFNHAMSHLLIVKRLELYMDLALYKINILLLLLLTAVVAVHVVAVPTARWRSTVTTICCRRSVHCHSGWSVVTNHDRTYRRHWFYSIEHSRGRRGIRYSFGCFSRIKKMLGRIETRNRDRIYCQTIRTDSDIYRDDRAIIATCSLRTPTDRQT